VVDSAVKWQRVPIHGGMACLVLIFCFSI